MKVPIVLLVLVCVSLIVVFGILGFLLWETFDVSGWLEARKKRLREQRKKQAVDIQLEAYDEWRKKIGWNKENRQ